MGKVIQLRKRPLEQKVNTPAPPPEMSEETKRRMDFLNAVYSGRLTKLLLLEEERSKQCPE
jgi:hypothetical protein